MAHRVVVVGGGFAGVQAVRGLADAPAEVTLVDRQNYTLFQPLVYQVRPARCRRQRSRCRCDGSSGVAERPGRPGEVTGFDLDAREVVLDDLPNGEGQTRLGYDTLVVATGRGTRTSATRTGRRTRRS